MSHEENTALPHKHMKHRCHTYSGTSRVTNTWTFMHKRAACSKYICSNMHKFIAL